METGFYHAPVMPGRCMEYLGPKPGETFLDGTLGGGGHAELILEKLTPGGRLVGIDRDGEAIEECRGRLGRFGKAFTAVRGNFKDAPEILRSLGIDTIDGAMLDLGTSSRQLTEAERGFSYNADAPLDMRMDRDAKLTARDVVNGYDQKMLARVIREYGEERFAQRIASFIAERRARKPIETTGELAEIITAAIPAKYRRQGPHPARRTFQALRIEVNGELEGLEEAIEGIAGMLGEGGRVCVLSFHSLEDRAAKQAMKRMENPCTCPKDAPRCVCGKEPMGRMLTRKPETPDERETEINPRSRSAKLRAFERSKRSTQRGE
jgi:16S rRNA (cytosine1402-N4)-methyltransferase